MTIVIYLYHGLTALDAIGVYEVLSRLPNAEVKFVGEERGLIVADTQFLKLVAEYSMTEVKTADILVIPGSTVGFMREAKKTHLLEWIREIHTTTQWTVSVCTGSIILAAAGLLKDKTACSHWAAAHLLNDYGATPVKERFVQHGKLITAQGVSAGIDMSLHLVAQIVGVEQARAYQLAIEYFPEPPLGLLEMTQADESTVDQARKIMQADALKDLSLPDVVRNARQLWKLLRGK